MKTTDKHYELFYTEIREWIEIFGLRDWQIHFQHKPIPSRAQVSYNIVDRSAIFTLGTNWEKKYKNFPINQIIRRDGFHEVCELLLSRLNVMTEQRYGLAERDVDKEVHRIIRVLENIVWEKEESWANH